MHARPREYYWLTEGKKVGTARPWGVNITIQWSISSEGLNTYNHAFGSTIGGHNSTFHHNLWACNTGRNPSIGMDGDFSLLNNVLYNWRHRTVDGGDQKSQLAAGQVLGHHALLSLGHERREEGLPRSYHSLRKE